MGSPVGFIRLSLAFLAVLAIAAPARSQIFNTAGEVALVEDYDTGAILYEKNADQPTPPASTAKLLTAEIVFRELKEGRLRLDDVFEVSEKAWREGGAHSHGAASFLALHSHVRIEDLLRGLLIQSGNDAAMTLAEGIGGTEDNFADIMNKRAAELGLTHSHFANARGKGDPKQYVTARDMAKLAAHVIRDDHEYYHYFSEKEFTWDKIRQLNRNPLLTLDVGADGLKAADTLDGGFGVVGSAVQDGQRLIVVMYGLKSAGERVEEARKLFDYGFHSFDHRTVFDAGQTIGTASVYGGESGEVPLVSERPIALFVPKGESGKLVAKIVYTGPLAAPVEKGQDAGELKIWRDDMLVVDAPLKTGAAVALGGLTSRAVDAGVELAGDAVRDALRRALSHK
jgi:D-alanyl-D-alanine carboxypeptidase (penicillin-binding protein 5/6)